MDINGHVAIVTGGASGLGAATADKLASQGAKVAVFDLNRDAAEAQAAKIGGIACACDVADPAAAAAALAEVTAKLGAPRVLINCAGIGVAKRVVGRDGPMKLEEFERVVRINLLGSFNMLRLAAAAMATLEPLAHGERGVVVNTASVAAFDGQIGQAAYAASKGGVAAMTLPIAREFASLGIRVMTIAPGLFKTPLVSILPQEAQDSLAAAIPFPRRLGLPEEFAHLAASIVENSYINGEVIRLDGALRMAPR